MKHILSDSSPLRLRTLGSNSLLISSYLFPTHHHHEIHVQALSDSGCSTFGFVDAAFAAHHGIMTHPLPVPRSVTLADGSTKQPVKA